MMVVTEVQALKMVVVVLVIKPPSLKLELYTKGFEEGYDLFVDSDYVNWLKLYHPESL